MRATLLAVLHQQLMQVDLPEFQDLQDTEPHGVVLVWLLW